MRFLALVSRFNWPHPAWSGRPAEDYFAWIEIRLRLMAEYTVPSVRNCYVKPDAWLLMVQSSPPGLPARVRQLAETAGVPVLLVPYRGDTLVDAVRHGLAECVSSGEILTSRLDTDDVVASDFFARLRSLELGEVGDGVVLSFPGGCNFDAAEQKFYYSSYPDNPFLSVVERVESMASLRTVFHRTHVELAASMSAVHSLRSFQPMWCSVIHADNTANQSLRKTNMLALSDDGQLRRRFGLRERSLPVL